MPKAWARLATFVLLAGLAGCASEPVAPTPPATANPSPEADPHAPGMIPSHCEALLNKSQEWGVSAESSRWKPASLEQALAAAEFFSAFHLVPESTSQFSLAWLQAKRPATDAEAQASLDKMGRAQTCDLLLAHKVLLGVVEYPWPAAERAHAAALLGSFVLNQQARVGPPLARAVQLDVVNKLAQRRLLPVNAKETAKLQKWFDAETQKTLAESETEKTAREQWEINRRELELSEQARVRLGKFLPLP